jgi:hypothetical protein
MWFKKRQFKKNIFLKIEHRLRFLPLSISNNFEIFYLYAKIVNQFIKKKIIWYIQLCKSNAKWIYEE